MYIRLYYVLIFTLCAFVSFLQVSWLGLEDSSDCDPCKFTLTSRSSTGGTERYILHSSSPALCQTWIHQISSILENQRNFLNGIPPQFSITRFCFCTQIAIEQWFSSHSLGSTCSNPARIEWSVLGFLKMSLRTTALEYSSVKFLRQV